MSLTYEEQLQYYADLLPIQYRGKVKAQATIQALARQALGDNIGLAIQNAFNLEDSVGVQLDVLGKYAGVDRDLFVPAGGVPLTDTDFRSLVFLALAVNNCRGSLQDIEELLFHFFGNGIKVFDNADMTLSYFFNASIGSITLLKAFVQLDLIPRPTGVGLASLIYAFGLDDYFAFASYYKPWPSGVSGWGSYYGADKTLFNGYTTIGTKVVTGIPDTSILTPGNPISGEGLDTGTFIDFIISPSQIQVTKNALTTQSPGKMVTTVLRPWINYSNVVSL